MFSIVCEMKRTSLCVINDVFELISKIIKIIFYYFGLLRLSNDRQ